MLSMTLDNWITVPQFDKLFTVTIDGCTVTGFTSTSPGIADANYYIDDPATVDVEIIETDYTPYPPCYTDIKLIKGFVESPLTPGVLDPMPVYSGTALFMNKHPWTG